jgi:hypothetical protein
MLAKPIPGEKWSDLNDLGRVGTVRSSKIQRKKSIGIGAGDLNISL